MLHGKLNMQDYLWIKNKCNIEYELWTIKTSGIEVI